MIIITSSMYISGLFSLPQFQVTTTNACIKLYVFFFLSMEKKSVHDIFYSMHILQLQIANMKKSVFEISKQILLAMYTRNKFLFCVRSKLNFFLTLQNFELMS
jgi:hypothetical protein